jgi:hypothetical protein
MRADMRLRSTVQERGMMTETGAASPAKSHAVSRFAATTRGAVALRAGDDRCGDDGA